MPSIFSAFDRNKTFKPVKNVQSSHHLELSKKLESTLNQDSYTDLVVQESVKLPPGENVNEWISFHMIDFYNKINAIFVLATCICGETQVPKKYKKATEVSAPEYIALSIDKIENLLNDTTIFSTSGDFPKDFRKIVKDMSKKIFRVYAHVFHQHFNEVKERKMETNFLFAFKHFLFFAMEFRLLNEKELEPMVSWIEQSTGIDVESYLKSKKKHKKKDNASSSSETSSTSSASQSSNNSGSASGSGGSDHSTSSDDKHKKRHGGHKRNDSLRAEDFNLIRRRSASVMVASDSSNTSSGNGGLSVGSHGAFSGNGGSLESEHNEKTIYTVEPNKISTLVVEVIEASNLEAKDLGDTSDGFAVLKFENQEVRTEVIWKELNPKWNARFTFIVKNISRVLHVSVYDENRLSKAELIGSADFNCQELADEEKHDFWLDLKNSKDSFAGRIHLQCTFTSSESGSMGYLKKITNLGFYTPLKQFLLSLKPSSFIGLFDNNKLNVDDKIYKSLIYLTTYGETDQNNRTEEFNVSVMKYIIRLEVEKTLRISQLLRSNSISTKLVGMYLKIFGQDYLKKTLQELTQKICEENKYLECSPDMIRKESEGSISFDPQVKAKENMNEIIEYSKQYMQAIRQSVSDMPKDIRQITSHLREQVFKKYENVASVTHDFDNISTQMDSTSMGTIAASSLLFLRFITPCITAPHLFQLVSTTPQKNAQRTLMLVSKILQQTANETEFSEKKEAFMIPANDFVREQKSNLRAFLDEVCDVNGDDMNLRDSTDNTLSEENNDRLLWSLYNIHVLFYDNDSTIYPLLQEVKKKNTTGTLAYFELSNENATQLVESYEQLRSIVGKLGSPPQLSLQARQRVTTAFSKRSDNDNVPSININ
ncbi:hypothetical protein FDP41_003704 [Naegleria fowleri]|uniref:Ras-GAP domain-containing protein n=1 Tax=Naegleria fowleri TaxID=5763 RepID=A0A6A5BRX4_NAEFO|nr:uncharacterized protein FDP41_003704 [Naegleria fowleri]KAF0977051.1 hypothetical protein FDP41_003704 [Naegleria fowleri]